MGLRVTDFNKCLDKKLLLFGYEIPDILAVFFLMSFLNFTLGPFGNRVFLVWLPSLIFALVLRISKRGKPDNFLLHWVRFKAMPKKISSFPSHPGWKVPPKLIKVKG